MRPQYEVVVIGAGFSGIGAGIRLRQSHVESFLILEKADDVGGTWRDNTYPGVAVDITSCAYSFSFEQNPRWSRIYAPGSEIQSYARHCADKYELRPHLRFGCAVRKTVFDEENHLWCVDTSSGLIRTRFLLNATGGLTQPREPEIEGLASFAGRKMHTARWEHDYELRGKRVAVIGTGASAVQIVPSIAPLVERLHVFQRTPIWVLPKPDRAVPEWAKTLFELAPPTQRAVRAWPH